MKRLLIPALLSALIVGCSSTPVPDETSGAPVESRSGSGVTPVTAGGLDARGLPRELSDPKSILSKRSIYFDLDSYVIKDEFKPVIDAHAKYLVSRKDRKIIIQGNTDERGGSEYNLALGQKRAEAVRRSLQALGVPDSQMEAISFGKEKPKAQGSNESAWAENRRADIVY